MAETVRKNLGMVTAYAYAVSKGYTGTEEEFAELMASYADVAQDAEASAQAAAQSATSASESAQSATTAEQKATQAADQLAKNTAQIETAGTATSAHSAGEYVMISNALYKVTTSVAKGDTWTIGTNVTAANVGSEISALNSSLSERYVYAPNGPVRFTNYGNSLLTFILAQYAKGYCAGDISLSGTCTDAPYNDGWGYAVHWQTFENGRIIVTAIRPFTYKFFLREIIDGAWVTGWKVSAAMTDA